LSLNSDVQRSVKAILFIAQTVIHNATGFGKADFPRDNPPGFKGIGYFVDPKIGIEVEGRTVDKRKFNYSKKTDLLFKFLDSSSRHCCPSKNLCPYIILKNALTVRLQLG